MRPAGAAAGRVGNRGFGRLPVDNECAVAAGGQVAQGQPDQIGVLVEGIALAKRALTTSWRDPPKHENAGAGKERIQAGESACR